MHEHNKIIVSHLCSLSILGGDMLVYYHIYIHYKQDDKDTLDYPNDVNLNKAESAGPTNTDHEFSCAFINQSKDDLVSEIGKEPPLCA